MHVENNINVETVEEEDNKDVETDTDKDANKSDEDNTNEKQENNDENVHAVKWGHVSEPPKQPPTFLASVITTMQSRANKERFKLILFV